MRKLFLTVAAFLYTFVLAPLPAQALPATGTIKFKLPTKTVNGLPLTGINALTKVQIFVAETAIPDSSSMQSTAEVAIADLNTTLGHKYEGEAGELIFVRIKACNSFRCSDFSNQASNTLPIPPDKPEAPSSVTIEIAI